MKRAFMLCMILAAFVTATASDVTLGPAELKGKVKPKWLRAEGDGTPGVSFEGTAAVTNEVGGLRIATEGTYAWDEDQNPDPLVAEVELWLQWDLYRPPRGGFNNVEEEMSSGYDFGTTEFGLETRFETDQEFDNHAWAGGLQAGYLSLAEIIPGVPLTASAYANLEWVEPFESETREALSVDEEGYVRLRASAALKYKLGVHLPSRYLNPISLHGDVRYYHDIDAQQEIKDEDLEEDIYWAGAVHYEINDLFNDGTAWIDAVFVRVSGGRVPPEVQDDTTIFLGIVIGDTD